ncbi:MAG: alpha/beta hydrolase [Candidatus Spyradocola sp.]
MKTEFFALSGVPAVLYGDPAPRVLLCVHGKMGCKEEGEWVARTACPLGWQVLAVDLPEHGARKGCPERLVPWQTVPELRAAMEYARARWRTVALYAVSIGAAFSLEAFADCPPDRALLLSPVPNLRALIERMMLGADVTAERLRAERTISTAFGETLEWDYYAYVCAHPVQRWTPPTAMLCAAHDALVPRANVDDFAARFGAELTIVPDAEHWFHTDDQLAVLEKWLREHLVP